MSTFPDVWRKNKDFGKIDYFLALYHIYPTAVKGIKNELSSGRQKFVFIWLRQMGFELSEKGSKCEQSKGLFAARYYTLR
jgi:hypothetical protein